MFCRPQIIINELHFLGKVHENYEYMDIILIDLPTHWRSQETILRVSQNLDNLTL